MKFKSASLAERFWASGCLVRHLKQGCQILLFDYLKRKKPEMEKLEALEPWKSKHPVHQCCRIYFRHIHVIDLGSCLKYTWTNNIWIKLLVQFEMTVNCQFTFGPLSNGDFFFFGGGGEVLRWWSYVLFICCIPLIPCNSTLFYLKIMTITVE